MKRLICLLMAMLLLLTTVGCATTDDGGDDPNAGKESSNHAASDGEDPDYVCDLPNDLNYKNAEIGILYANVIGRDDELVSENNGGVVSSAVHERNVLVEEALKVKLKFHPEKDDTEVVHAMDKDISGGMGEHQIVVNGTYLSVRPAISGNYLNLSALENIDTSKKYWTQGYNEMVTFTDENMQFLATGATAIFMYRYMYATLYNKTLFGNHKIPDLYETVVAGDWTMDYQYKILNDIFVEVDGKDGKTEGDYYGFVSGDLISVDPYTVASDVHVIIKDKGTNELAWNDNAISELSDLCDKVQLLYNAPFTYIYSGVEYDYPEKNYIIQHFADERAVMVTAMFVKLEKNFEDLGKLSYGVAPMPKFDKNQDRYYSYVQDQVSSFGISSVISKEDEQEMLAAVLESMAYHSYRLVRPAYYETALSERYMQDPQSVEILDTIFDTMYFDFSSTCSNIFTCVIRDKLRPLYSASTNTISSSTNSWKRTIQRDLRRHNESLEKLKAGS